MVLDANDRYSLRLVMWKEARGSGLAACFLVGHVCLNRVGKPGFAKTLHDVIYGKNQFTSMSVPSDPEFNLAPPANDAVWVALEHVVDNIVDADDPTRGALYYANPRTMQPGGWFERNISGPGPGYKGTLAHPLLIVEGRHYFYA